MYPFVVGVGTPSYGAASASPTLVSITPNSSTNLSHGNLPHSSSGTVNVSGAPIAEAVKFLEEFPITFKGSGLPRMPPGNWQASMSPASESFTSAFVVSCEISGSHSFTVRNSVEDTPTPSTGTVVVAGTPTSVTINCEKGGSLDLRVSNPEIAPEKPSLDYSPFRPYVYLSLVGGWVIAFASFGWWKLRYRRPDRPQRLSG